MKNSLFLLTFLFVSNLGILGQTNSPELIEFKGRKIFFKGEKVRKTKIKDLRAIIHTANDQRANELLKGYQTVQIVSYIPLVGALGCLGVAATTDNGTSGGLQKQERLLIAGLGLTITGLIVNGLGWPLKGKPAVHRYNEVIKQKSTNQNTSFHLISPSKSLGLGVGLSF